MSKLNAFVWWRLLHPFPHWGKGCCLATADYRRLLPFGQERPAVCVLELSYRCVLELSYCGASSPVKKGKATMFSYGCIGATGYAGYVGTALLLCLLELTGPLLLQRLFPRQGERDCLSHG